MSRTKLLPLAILIGGLAIAIVGCNRAEQTPPSIQGRYETTGETRDREDAAPTIYGTCVLILEPNGTFSLNIQKRIAIQGLQSDEPFWKRFADNLTGTFSTDGTKINFTSSANSTFAGSYQGGQVTIGKLHYQPVK